MRSATDVFSEWAQLGKDVGMESGHAPAVKEILSAAFDEWGDGEFCSIDAGCGNGWVVRMLKMMPNCVDSMGVDGATSMIERAHQIDPSGTYIGADLSTWNPDQPVDLVHSMEVLYYLENIQEFLNRVYTHWLREDGIFAFGIDHYYENMDCHGWSEKVGVHMAMYSENEWRQMVEKSGFKVIRMFRAAQTQEWAGTLTFILKKTS
jgi:predicted TPR repeat methyltransferase